MRGCVLALAAIVVMSPQPSNVEQAVPGPKPAAALVESFDGLGVGFEGPQGRAEGRNPSDESETI